jgi:hypothetical protein
LIYLNASGSYLLSTNSNGTYAEIVSAVSGASRVGFRDILVGVLTTTTRTLYLNGTAIASASGTYLDPLYGATATLCAGSITGFDKNPACVFEGGAVWNRALSLAEIRSLQSDFFAPVRPRSALAGLAATLSGPGQVYSPAALLSW